MPTEMDVRRRLSRPAGCDSSSREMWLLALRSTINRVLNGQDECVALMSVDANGLDSLEDALFLAAACRKIPSGNPRKSVLIDLTTRVWSTNPVLVKDLYNRLSQSPQLVSKISQSDSNGSVLLLGLCGIVAMVFITPARSNCEAHNNEIPDNRLQSLPLCLPSELIDAIMVVTGRALQGLCDSIPLSNGKSIFDYMNIISDLLYLMSQTVQIDSSVWLRIPGSVMSATVLFCETSTIQMREAETNRVETVWIEMARQSAVGIIESALANNPSLALFRPLRESLVFLTSEHWYLQQIAFSLLRCTMIHLLTSDHEPDISNSPSMISSAETDATAVSLKPAQHQSRPMKQKIARTATDASLKRLDDSAGGNNVGSLVAGRLHIASAGLSSVLKELSANGHLWIVSWAMIHQRQSVRHSAAFVLQVFLELSSINSAKVLNEFWISLIEQGLVSNLYCAAAGIPLLVEEVHGDEVAASGQKMSTFPEPFISRIAVDILNGLTDAFCGESDQPGARRSELLQRTVMSLVYSRNPVLRGNVLSSVILLITNHPKLKSVIWLAQEPTSDESSGSGATAPLVPGAVFRQMLRNAMKEESEFKMVVDVLLHRLRWRLDTLQLSSAMVFVADKIGDPNRALVFVGPGKSKDTVWVMSSAVPSRAPGLSGKADTAAVTAAHPVELVRPNMSIVNWHSPALARDIQELEKHWAEINVPMKMATKSPLPPDFRVLPGDYGVWQDVFSHMMDDYLLNTSAARADVATLLRLYNLSEIHDIQVLRTAYIGAISKKLSIDNISQVLAAALGHVEIAVKKRQLEAAADVLSPVAPIALILVRDCLAFLGSHPASLMPSKHNAKLRSEIEGLLFNYISLIFND